MDQEQARMLEKVAEQSVLDSLFEDHELPALQSVPDATLARVYDQLMYKGAEKRASATAPKADPEVEGAMEKIAEAQIWGREAARSYAATYLAGAEKIAQGLAGLRERITGRSQGERENQERRALAMEALRRRQEVALRGPESELELGTSGAQRLQQLTLKEIAEQQRMQESLRKLRLADQYARREREQGMFEREQAGPGGALRPMAGGALLGTAVNALLRQVRPESAIQRFGRAPLMGAGLGLGMHLARSAAQPKDRVVSRLERQMYMPGPMTSDVGA